MGARLNEKLFEERIREIIKEEVLPNNSDLMLIMAKKVVDILVCRNGARPALFFIEVKFHQKHHDRLGFGGAGGGGFQPEILNRNPDYFSRNLRWIIGDEGHGLDEFLLLTNEELAEYVSGGIVGRKHNNIRLSLLRDGRWMRSDELISQLAAWTEQ